MTKELGRVGPRTEFKSAFILSYDLLGQNIQDSTSTFRIYAQIWYGGRHILSLIISGIILQE